MQPFRNYVDQTTGLRIVSVVTTNTNSLVDEDYRDEVNGALADVTEEKFEWPQEGLEAIQDVLSNYDIILPDIELNTNSSLSNEEVFVIVEYSKPVEVMKHLNLNLDSEEANESLFLYFFFESEENGKSEFYVEIVTRDELTELMDDFHVDIDDAQGTESRS